MLDRQQHLPAGNNDGLFSIPRGVVSHDLGVGGDVLWGQLGRLIWLRVDPAEGLHFLLLKGKFKMTVTTQIQTWIDAWCTSGEVKLIMKPWRWAVTSTRSRVSYFEVFVTRQLVGQVDSLVCSPLRHHDDATNLLHLRVVWWTGAIQVACNLRQQKAPWAHTDALHLFMLALKWWATLKQIPTHLCSKIWDANELLEDVLRQDVGVARLLDVIRRHIDVVCSEMEVGRRYSPDKEKHNCLVNHLPQ